MKECVPQSTDILMRTQKNKSMYGMRVDILGWVGGWVGGWEEDHLFHRRFGTICSLPDVFLDQPGDGRSIGCVMSGSSGS